MYNFWNITLIFNFEMFSTNKMMFIYIINIFQSSRLIFIFKYLNSLKIWRNSHLNVCNFQYFCFILRSVTRQHCKITQNVPKAVLRPVPCPQDPWSRTQTQVHRVPNTVLSRPRVSGIRALNLWACGGEALPNLWEVSHTLWFQPPALSGRTPAPNAALEFLCETEAPSSGESEEKARLCACFLRQMSRRGPCIAPSSAVKASEWQDLYSLVKQPKVAPPSRGGVSPPSLVPRKTLAPKSAFSQTRAAEKAACAPSCGREGGRLVPAGNYTWPSLPPAVF